MVQTLKKRKMGPHQVGAMSGKPQEEGRGKEDAGKRKIGNRRYRSQEDEEDPSLEFAEAIV